MVLILWKSWNLLKIQNRPQTGLAPCLQGNRKVKAGMCTEPDVLCKNIKGGHYRMKAIEETADEFASQVTSAFCAGVN